MEYSIYISDMGSDIHYQCPDCKRNLSDDLWKVDKKGYAMFHTKESLAAKLKDMSCPGCGQNRGNDDV